MAGILGGGIDDFGAHKGAQQWPNVGAKVGMRAIHRGSRFLGEIVRVMPDGVVIRGASSDERAFRFMPGAFMVEAKAVTLFQPRPVPSQRPTVITASGSVKAPAQRAKVARPSRLWVEGIHDAALVEKVWGDDLREAAIVVERLDGIDDLATAVADFGPDNSARLGVLVDHLVPGSKEWHITERVRGPYVAIAGTPYVDVWQAVRPNVIGIKAWPVISRDEEWKAGICKRLGGGEPAEFWRKLLASVRTYADLEPSFVGAVESLLDFLLAE
jgi:Protein of unknown function (DUF3097)